MLFNNSFALPKKLKDDAIVEAVAEIRFNSEGSSAPEVFVGRLVDDPRWRGFEQRRLPSAEIPSSIRSADPRLRFQPILELSGPEGHLSCKVGPYVVSYHNMAPYIGWDQFQAEFFDLIDFLFARTKAFHVQRLGLRYINALNEEKHFVKGLPGLNLSVSVGQVTLEKSFNLNFSEDIDHLTRCFVRVASHDLVEGAVPANTAAIIDVDVFTKVRPNLDAAAIKAWYENAHIAEKCAFFALLRAETIDLLREE